ncbi:hypothetical protein [Paenibacillus physcomitrellae]|uniref:Uncharacterized protein n=1 Tax=Paenibacillus physcomitrellae TaxID=1619311 RepID=A0ABQ1FML7_9BACL|nr:hypothetical protein [Paenibacillus physcomitrellae]GGA22920.1 hypothetical protein GCM10010917_04600 [Paenibacillus physcomitrellae]
MNSNRDEEEYTALFIQFSSGVERWLRKGLILLIICLFMSQLLLQIPSVRSVISSAERWEGKIPKPITVPVKIPEGN